MHLRNVELPGKWLVLCHNCTACAAALSPAPTTPEELLARMVRNRRSDVAVALPPEIERRGMESLPTDADVAMHQGMREQAKAVAPEVQPAATCTTGQNDVLPSALVSSVEAEAQSR